MDQNVVFRWIWRFNAIAIAFALLLIGAVALPQFATFRVAPTIERIMGPATTTKEVMRLFMFGNREGRREIVFALAPDAGVWDSDGTPIVGQYADTTRIANYLYIDPLTGSTRWLFPTNDQVIAETDYVTKTTMSAASPQPAPSPSEPILVVAYSVKSVATSGTATKDGKYRVYLSRLDGTNLTKILDKLDEPASFAPAADNTLFISYRVAGRRIVSSVSIAEFTVLMTKDLAEYEAK